MTTKNLVPRANNEGELGILTRKWKGINAVSGSFDELKTDNLLDTDGNQLLVAGVGVTITPENGSITIASSSSSNAQVDKIFSGPTINDIVQENSLVQTFYDENTPSNNKIVFKTDNEERWIIDNNGHLVPKTNTSGNSSDYNLGSLDSRVNSIYVENNGINFKSHLHPQIQTGLNVTTKQKLQFGIYNSETSSFDYDNVLIAKEDVKVASTSPLINLLQSSTNTNILKLMQLNNIDVETTITIDNVLLSDGDKVLIKDFDTTEMAKNGIYTISGVGSAVTLERIETLNDGDDFSNIKVTVLEGTENGQQIFLTVPNVNSGVVGKAVGVDPMKWVRVSGGGGLKAIEEDLLPKLGADLNLNDKRIFNSGSTIRIAANANVDDNGGISISELSGLNTLKLSDSNKDNVLEFKDNNTSSSLRLYGTSLAYPLDANKTVNFYFKPLTTEYNDATNHVDAVIATRAWASSQFLSTTDGPYATQSFVTSQGYLTTHQSLDSYIQINDSASLNSLILSNTAEDQNSWTDNNAVTKSYVTNLIQGINKVLEPARVAIKSNVALNTLKENLQVNTSSQVTLSSGDRVLLAGQTDPIQNGVYLIAANGVGQGGAETERVTDLAVSDQAAGTFIFIEEGDSAESGFICAAPSTADTVGTHDLSFFKMSGIANTSVTSTSALTLANNALSVNVDGTTIEKINDPAATNPLSNQILRVKEIPVDKLVLGGANSDVKINANLLPELNAETVNESKFNIDDVSSTATNLAAEDMFIIYDNDSSDTPKTAKITALNIDKYVRNNLNDVSGDIRLTFTADSTTHGTLEAKVHNELYDNRVEKSDVTDANGDITRDGIVDEDLLLIRDSISTDKYGRTQTEFNEIVAFTDSDNNNLDDVTGLIQASHDSYRNGGFTPSDEAKIKKVKYSTLKSKIAESISTDLDINGLPLISDDNLGDLDELALFNMPPSSEIDRILPSVRVLASNLTDIGSPSGSSTGSYQSWGGVSLAVGQEIDGVTLNAGDRVLVSAWQTNRIQGIGNGVWVVPANGNTAVRGSEAKDIASGEPFDKSFVKVLEGSVAGGNGYILEAITNQDEDEIDVDRMKVVQWNQTLENKKVTVKQLSDNIRKGVENYEVVDYSSSGEKSITVKSNKHYLLISPPEGNINNKFILKFYNDGTSGNGYEAPIIGDTVKISVLSNIESDLITRNHPSATVECKFSENSFIHLNNKTLEKTVTFFYQKSVADDGEGWSHKRFNSENIELAHVNTSSYTSMTYPTTTSNRAGWFSIDGTSVYQSTNPTITLPDISEIVSHNIPLGTIKKFYFTHAQPESAVFKSDCIIVKRQGSASRGFGFKALETGQTTPQIEIPLTGGFVNKVTVTLIGNNSNANTIGWYIENASLESGSSELPTPSVPIKDKVLVYNSDTNNPVLEFSKLGKDNIELGVLEGGKTIANNSGFTTTGNIKKETIVGGTNSDADRGNIALNTVTKDNLEKLDNNKVFGRIDLNDSPATSANTEHIDVITQLDEFTDEQGNIFVGLNALNKIQRFSNPGKVIPTARAVIQYFELQRLGIEDASSQSSSARQVNAIINDPSIATSGSVQLLAADGITGVEITPTGAYKTLSQDGFNNTYPLIRQTHPNVVKYLNVSSTSFYTGYLDPSNVGNYGKWGTSLGIETDFSYPVDGFGDQLGYYNKYSGRNMLRVILPPASAVYNLFGNGGSVTFTVKSFENTSDWRDNTVHGLNILPNQSDILYTYSDIVNFNSLNTVRPTFISQYQDPDLYPTLGITYNDPNQIGYIGFPKAQNFATSAWKNNAEFTFKASVFLKTNIKLYYPSNRTQNSLFKQENTQPESYLWILEKV